MGFESFYVQLDPSEHSSLSRKAEVETFFRLTKEIRCAWPVLVAERIDGTSATLTYKTKEGLFLLSLFESNRTFRFGMEVAYCNPKTVIEPFCRLTEDLMERYALSCHIGTDLSPEQDANLSDFSDPSLVRKVVPSAWEYNRRLWQLDAGTDEEAILRPGEAIAHFITPQLQYA